MSDKSRSRSAPNPGWFPKGRSGNLKGRPISSRPLKSSAFEVLVEKTIPVARRGATREITMEEALQQRTYRDALAGKRMAQREVLRWIMKRAGWLTAEAPKASWPAITRHISPGPDNADAVLQLLVIAALNPARAGIGADRAQL